MNNENLQSLAEIYNNLLRVHTNGEDSFIMADCMRALFNIIKAAAESSAKVSKEEE